jgi:Passenger-associated-transport-repeat
MNRNPAPGPAETAVASAPFTRAQFALTSDQEIDAITAALDRPNFKPSSDKMLSFPISPRNRMNKRIALWFIIAGSISFAADPANAASGTWTANSSGVWSDTTKWSGGVVADGAGSTANFSTIDINSGRTVTIDGAVASRTIGTLLLGDTTGNFFAWTFAASGSATLTFNNNGSGAVLTQVASSGSNILGSTLPIILGDNLTINNNAATTTNARTLTISGGITGGFNLTLNSNDANGGAITLNTNSVNNGGTITNSGTGTGTTTITGGVGSNVTGITQNSTTSALTISTTALSVNAGGTTLTNSSGTKLLTVSSGVTGTGNLVLKNNSATNNGVTLTTTSVNNTGTITNSGTGIGTTTITGGVGSNVTGITQNSTTSALTISTTALSVNAGGTTLTNSSGTKLLTVSGGVTGTGNLVLKNNSATNGGVTLTTTSVNNTGTITNSGTGTGTTIIDAGIGSNVLGVTQNSASSALILSGPNTYTGGTDVNAGTLALGASNVLADTGAVTVGGGTFDIGANSDTVGTVTLTSGNINGSGGTLTGSSYGVQSGSISAKLGGSAALTKSMAGTVILTGANTYTGGTNVNEGILQLDASNVLPDTGTVTLAGGNLRLNGVQEGTTGAAGAGALDLTSNSIIDLASTSLIHFLASGGQSWSGTLSIYNWSGTPVTGGGAEQILFGTNTSTASLTQAQLDQISFYSGSGTGFLGTGSWATVGNGEIVPTAIPEPGTWLAGGLIAVSLLITQRRRFIRRTVRS